MTKKTEDFALYFIIGSLYAFAVNISILATTIIEVPLGALFALGLALLAVFAAVFYNRMSTLIFTGLLAASIFIMFLVRDRLTALWSLVDYITLLMQGYIPFREELSWPIVFAIALLTALFVAVCLYINFHFYLLAIFGTSIFTISWLMDYPSSLMGFIIFLFCFCVLLVRKFYGLKNNGTRTALITAPLCAIVVAVSATMPLPNATLDNTAITRFFNAPLDVIGEFFFLAFNPRYFSFQTTGFSGQGGRLGGPVSPNNRPVMSVDAGRRIYLSGATHNIYTGYSWESDSPEFVPIYGNIHPSYIEFMETTHSLFRNTARIDATDHRLMSASLTSYLPLNYVHIFMGNNRTSSLFRPLRERGVQFEDYALNDSLLVNASGDRRVDIPMPRDTVYRYSFLDIDYREPHIQEILRRSRRGYYRDRFENSSVLFFAEIWVDDEAIGIVYVQRHQHYHSHPRYQFYFVSALTGSSSVTFQGIQRDFLASETGGLQGFNSLIDTLNMDGSWAYMFSDMTVGTYDTLFRMLGKLLGAEQDLLLIQYADFVYENYLQLPDTLPQRVIDLAHDITRYYYTDYDKIRALQEFLIQFPYTLNPGPVPQDRDFVDYFLFDGQMGYCVYYASAMVVLTRAIGIPARYVEGFLLPPARDPETGLFSVTNRDAHAWAEVYLEGFGWIIVETTAPYVFAMYERPFDPTTLFVWDDFYMDPWAWEDQFWMMGLDWYADDWYMWDTEGRTPAQQAQQAEPPEPINWLSVITNTAMAIPFLTILYLLLWYALRTAKQRKVGRMTANERVIYYYREILKITGYYDYPLENEETLYEYGERIRNHFSFSNGTKFMGDLNKIYYRARYDDMVEKPINEEEAAFVSDCYYELVDSVRKNRGRKKFLYMKYVKGLG